LRQPAASWPGPEEGTERVPDAPDEEEVPSEFALIVANGKLQSPGEDHGLGPTVCARMPQTKKLSREASCSECGRRCL